MSNKMAPDLGKLDELAKVHALSYASPHHFTMSVNGLREVIAELQLPAGNKMALDALTKLVGNVWGHGATTSDGCFTDDPLEKQCRAAIAALQAEPQGWMPIETAPKDGSTYLVADAVRGMVAPHIRGVIHNNPGTAHDWQYGEAATHWMPLPTPPKD